MSVDKEWKVIITNEYTKEIKNVKEFDKIKELSPEELLIQEINNAKSVNDILDIVGEKKEYWKYESENVIDAIVSYLKWESDSNVITRYWNLRQKVIELKNADYIKKSKLSKLWPNWLNAKTEQWNVWNCYFVWALNAVKNHPNWWELITQMIKIKWEWIWEVDFKWYNKKITITMADIEGMRYLWEDWRMKDWFIDTKNIWDLIIERAHARAVNQIRWWKKDETFKINHNWELNHDWWHMEEVLKLFYWNNVSSEKISTWTDWKLYSQNIKWDYGDLDMDNKLNIFTNFLMSNLSNDKLIWLSSLSTKWKSDIDKYIWSDINGRKVTLYHQHQYTISNFNKKEWWVAVVNPHDSSQEVIYRISDIWKYFRNITIININ